MDILQSCSALSYGCDFWPWACDFKPQVGAKSHKWSGSLKVKVTKSKVCDKVHAINLANDHFLSRRHMW